MRSRDDTPAFQARARAAVARRREQHPQGTPDEMVAAVGPSFPGNAPALRLAPDEPDQVLRLQAFRAAHPDIIIGHGDFGIWEGRIPEPTGETVTIRYTLRELLDRLHELTVGGNL